MSRQFGDAGILKSQVRTEHLTVTSYVSDDKVYAGNRVSLILDIELPAKMHVYAPTVKKYRPVELQVDPNPNVQILTTTFPRATTMNLPAIKERVPVFSGKFRVTKDVIVGTEDILRKETVIELSGSFTYQACDDKICYLETKVPLKFSFQVLNQDIPRVPENLRRR